jgi:hypothetical protein
MWRSIMIDAHTVTAEELHKAADSLDYDAPVPPGIEQFIEESTFLKEPGGVDPVVAGPALWLAYGIAVGIATATEKEREEA